MASGVEIETNFGIWARSLDKETCAELLQEQGVPATPVNSPADLLDSPHLAARKFFRTVELDNGQPIRVPEVPMTFDVGSEPIEELGAKSYMRDGTLTTSGRYSICDLEVAEFGHVLAVPLAGSWLGMMGARDTRIEETRRLDLYRRRGPFADGIAGPNRSGYFIAANHSKDNLVVDSDEPDDCLATIGRLVDRSDVLLENLGEARLQRLGVSKRGAREERAQRLWVSCSGLGGSGPQSHYKTYGHNLHAYGGLVFLTRGPDNELVDLGTAWADPLSGIAIATAVAAWALSENRPTCVIDVSMAEVVASNLAEYIAQASYPSNERWHSAEERKSFGGTYECGESGNLIALCISTDEEWRSLLKLFGDPSELDRDFDWLMNRSNQQEANLLLGSCFAHLEAYPLAVELQNIGICAFPVWAARDLVQDRHLKQRHFFPIVEQPELGKRSVIGIPWQFVGEQPITPGPAPILRNEAS